MTEILTVVKSTLQFRLTRAGTTIFFKNPPHLEKLFRKYCLIEIPDKHKIISCGKVISSILEAWKTMLYVFL